MECVECYSEDNTKRPRLGDIECLENHFYLKLLELQNCI